MWTSGSCRWLSLVAGLGAASVVAADLYVGGDVSGSVAQFSDTGVFKRVLLTSAEETVLTTLRVGYDNALYVASARQNRVYRYDLGTGSLTTFIDLGAPPFEGIHGMAIDPGPGHDFYVMSMGGAGRLRRFSGSTGAFLGEVGTPYGLGVGVDLYGGEIVVSYRYGEAYRFDGTLHPLTTHGNAEDVRVLPDGLVYVTNYKGTIERYDLGGAPYGRFNNHTDPTLTTGFSAYETHAPTWTPWNTVYVTQFGVSGVAEISPWSGEIIRTFDVTSVSGVGRPWGMTFGPEAMGPAGVIPAVPEPTSALAFGVGWLYATRRRARR